MRGGRVLYICGVLVSVAVFAGSEAMATPRSEASGLMAVGRAGHPITVNYVVPGGVGGPVAQMLVIGRPGTTPEVGPHVDRLPPSAVERDTNQLALEASFTDTTLSARLVANAPGTYPVFVFASTGEMGCGSSDMHEPIDLAITQVGQVRVD
jgi:hypothetical protein